MKRVFAAAVMAAMTLPAAPQPDVQEMAATLTRLAATVRRLEVEVAKEKLRRQGEVIANISRELDMVREQREQMEGMERAYGQELQSVAGRLSEPTLSAEERSDLEARRATLSPARIQARRSDLIVREAKLQDVLREERKLGAEFAAAAGQANTN